MKPDEKVILLLIPEDDLRNILAEALHQYECPFSYKIVSTTQEANDLLSRGIVQAIIMTPAAALGSDGTGGLIVMDIKLPPTITLIQSGYFPDYLYIPGAFNDWCTVPFSLEELFNRLSSLLNRANKG